MCGYTGESYTWGVSMREAGCIGVWARKTCLVARATGVCLWEGLARVKDTTCTGAGCVQEARGGGYRCAHKTREKKA